MIVIEGKENIAIYRMITLEKALKLEMIGLKGRGKSAYSIIKSEFGLKGSREKVHAQFKEMIRELTAKAEVDAIENEQDDLDFLDSLCEEDGLMP